MIYIFDIDGTLSNAEHRLHFLNQTPPDWEAFYNAAGGDLPNFEVITVARSLINAGQRVLLVSGRTESIRGITEQWLSKYRVPYEILYMRKDGDHRQDNALKSEILDNILTRYPQTAMYNEVAGVFEDRQQVVNMYRARGLRVFQVAEGKY